MIDEKDASYAETCFRSANSSYRCRARDRSYVGFNGFAGPDGSALARGATFAMVPDSKSENPLFDAEIDRKVASASARLAIVQLPGQR